MANFETREIRINVQEGQVPSGLQKLMELSAGGVIPIKVRVENVANSDAVLKSLQDFKIQPTLDFGKVNSQIKELENELTSSFRRISETAKINVEINSSGGARQVAQQLEPIAQQVRNVQQLGQTLGKTYEQSGSQMSNAIRSTTRQLEELRRTQEKLQAQSFDRTGSIAGLPIRKFTKEELESGASTRLDQRLRLRGVDQATIIPGEITRAQSISPFAGASEVLKQKAEFDKLEKKAVALESRLEGQIQAAQQAEARSRETLITGLAKNSLNKGIDASAITGTNTAAQSVLSEIASAQNRLQNDPTFQAAQALRQQQLQNAEAKKLEKAQTQEQQRQQRAEEQAIKARQNLIDNLAKRASNQNVDVGLLPSSDNATASVLREVAEAQERLKADPIFQAQQIASSAASANKIAREFSERVQFKEFFARSEDERRAVRSRSIGSVLGANPNVPGLAERLSFEATNGALPRLFDLKRLAEPGVGSQIAFGGLFGGKSGPLGAASGIAAAAIGGAVGGAPGALLGSTVQQVAEGLISPLVEGINKHKDEFIEAGRAYEGSLLSLGATFQNQSELLGAGGKALGSTNIQAQLNFREEEARKIQLSARRELLPIGIGGSTEATFVRGIVAALGQRGITASADQTAEIAKILGGVIQTQRPQLLENTSLLNRDLQDVLSGLPQASRTILGSLIRDSIPGLARATTGDDVLVALRKQSAFADVAQQSKSPIALQNKLLGAEDQLKTVGGEAFLKAQSRGLEYQGQKLAEDPSFREGAEKWGRAMGELDASARIVSTTLSQGFNRSLVGTFTILEDFGTIVGAVSDGLARLNPNVASLLDTEKALDQVAKNVEAAAVAGEKQKVTNRVKSALEGAGLEDDVEKFKTTRLQGTEARLTTLDKLQSLFSGQDEFKEFAPALFRKQIDLLSERNKERTSLFSGNEGQIQSGRLFLEETLPAQLQAAQGLVNSATENFNTAAQKFNETRKSNDEIDQLIAREQSSLRSLEQNRKTNPATGTQAEIALAESEYLKERAEIKGRINDLQFRKRDQVSSSAAGDPEIQGSLDQIISAEREVLQLKNKALEVTRAETDLILKRLPKIQSANDESTQVGAQASAVAQTEVLEKAGTKARESLAVLDSQLKNIGEQRNVLAESSKSISDPTILKKRQQQINDLDKLEQQKTEERKEAILEVQSLELRRFQQIEKSADVRNKSIDVSRSGLDLFSINNQIKDAELSRTRSLNSIGSAREGITQLEQFRSRFPDDVANRPGGATEQELERLRNSIPANQKNISEQDRNIEFGSRQREQVTLDLQQARREEARLIADETAKRKQLNLTVEQSRQKLDQFNANIRAQNAGRGSQILGLADRIRELDPNALPVGFSNLSDEDRRQIELASAVEQFNSAVRPLGRSTASGGTIPSFGTPLAGSEVDNEIRQQELALSEANRHAAEELEDFASVIKRTRNDLEQRIRTDEERLGIKTFGPRAPRDGDPVNGNPSDIDFTPNNARPAGLDSVLNTQQYKPSTELKTEAAAKKELPGGKNGFAFDDAATKSLQDFSSPLDGMSDLLWTSPKGNFYVRNDVAEFFNKADNSGIGTGIDNSKLPVTASERDSKSASNFVFDTGAQLEFPQLDAPIREIEPVVEVRGKGNKQFVHKTAAKEGAAHAEFRNEVGAGLLSAFAGGGVVDAPGRVPNIANANLADGILRGELGINNVSKKKFVSDIKLPRDVTAGIPLPTEPKRAEVGRTATAAQSAQASGQREIIGLTNAINQAIATLSNLRTGVTVKLDQESAGVIGSNIQQAINGL